MSRMRVFDLVVFALLISESTRADIVKYDLVMAPDDSLIYHSTYNVRASSKHPGFIDLSRLSFTASSEAKGSDSSPASLNNGSASASNSTDDGADNEDDQFDTDDGQGQNDDVASTGDDGNGDGTDDGDEGTDDGIGLVDGTDDGNGLVEGSDDGDGSDDGSGGRYRKYVQRNLQGSSSSSSGFTTLDVAILRLPNNCATTKEGCDWTALGVGKNGGGTVPPFCCSRTAITNKLCDASQYSRLIFDQTKFNGQYRPLAVPNSGEWSKQQISDAKIKLTVSGRYDVLVANCNAGGREIHISGSVVYKSEHGYLPGNLYGFLLFYVIALAMYCVLFFWYGISVHAQKTGRVSVENWVFVTITLGLLETFLTSAYLVWWNSSGKKHEVFAYASIFAGAFKRGMIRCLLIVLSLGWGVLSDTLSRSSMRATVILGAVYVGVSIVHDILLQSAVAGGDYLSKDDEGLIFDFDTVFGILAGLATLLAFVWVFYGLMKTSERMKNMKTLEQGGISKSFRRFRYFRVVVICWVLLATFWEILTSVYIRRANSSTKMQNQWLQGVGKQCLCLFLLIMIACIWKPGSSDKAADFNHDLELAGEETQGYSDKKELDHQID